MLLTGILALGLLFSNTGHPPYSQSGDNYPVDDFFISDSDVLCYSYASYSRYLDSQTTIGNLDYRVSSTRVVDGASTIQNNALVFLMSVNVVDDVVSLSIFDNFKESYNVLCSAWFTADVNDGSSNNSYSHFFTSWVLGIEASMPSSSGGLHLASFSFSDLNMPLDTNYDISLVLMYQLLSEETFNTYTSQYTNGYNDGQSQGYATGYDEGYSNGHSQGLEDGERVGYLDGYEEGHTDGYADGYEASLNDHDFSFTNLFASISDTPILMIRRLFGFELFGTSLIAVFMSLFTALIVIHIIKKVF